MWGKGIQWAWCRGEALFRGEEPRERQGVVKVKVRGRVKGTPGSLNIFIQCTFISLARWPKCSNWQSLPLLVG